MNFDEFKNKFTTNGENDPFSDPKTWVLFKEYLPDDVFPLFFEQEAAFLLEKKLPDIFRPNDIFLSVVDVNNNKLNDKLTCWVRVGNAFRNRGLYAEAIAIYLSLLSQLQESQDQMGHRSHKGEPLWFIYDCYTRLGFPFIAKRYLMLSMVEDALTYNGNIPRDKSGAYIWLVRTGNLSSRKFENYEKEISKYKSNSNSKYPEWVLQQIDDDWIIEHPSEMEVNRYFADKKYIKYLLSKLGMPSGRRTTSSGIQLELLAEYLLSCIPGVRTKRHALTYTTDHDVVCTYEGLSYDFRSELGRYFVCECKDNTKGVPVTHLLKFCRVLDSIKARFGIIFATKGISKPAEAELKKFYQDRGVVIVVIDKADIELLAEGDNFIAMLRRKYERIKLDLKEGKSRARKPVH